MSVMQIFENLSRHEAQHNTPRKSSQSTFAEIFEAEKSSMQYAVENQDTVSETYEKPGSLLNTKLKIGVPDKFEIDTFNNVLQKALRNADVDSSKEIELGIERGSGRIIVENDHLDKDKIEKMFEDNFELRNEYVSITNRLSLGELVRHTAPFHQEYRENPEAAVSKYSYLFNTSPETKVNLKDGAFNYSFTWQQRVNC